MKKKKISKRKKEKSPSFTPFGSQGEKGERERERENIRKKKYVGYVNSKYKQCKSSCFSPPEYEL
jgi:hypothetical protein